MPHTDRQPLKALPSHYWRQTCVPSHLWQQWSCPVHASHHQWWVLSLSSNICLALTIICVFRLRFSFWATHLCFFINTRLTFKVILFWWHAFNVFCRGPYKNHLKHKERLHWVHSHRPEQGRHRRREQHKTISHCCHGKVTLMWLIPPGEDCLGHDGDNVQRVLCTTFYVSHSFSLILENDSNWKCMSALR